MCISMNKSVYKQVVSHWVTKQSIKLNGRLFLDANRQLMKIQLSLRKEQKFTNVFQDYNRCFKPKPLGCWFRS